MRRKNSEIVIDLANMASEGNYDPVSPSEARWMNELYEDVARLINELEEQENE